MGVYPNEARVQSLDTSAACITRDWAAACQRTLGNLIRQLMSYFLIAPHHQHCTGLPTGLEGGFLVPGGVQGVDEGRFDIDQMSRISYDPTERHRSGQSYFNLSQPSPVASVASDEPSVASTVTIESYTPTVERSKKKSSPFEKVQKVKVTFSPRPQPDTEFRPRLWGQFWYRQDR